jgi:hypothetical protein
MRGLEKIFNVVKEELYEEQSDIINKEFHTELKELDNNNVSYDIFIGWYDYDGFNIDRQLNNYSNGGIDIDDGFDFVEYLKDYYDNLDYGAVCQLQVRADNDNMDTIYIEYNGYELFYDRY